MDTGRYKGQEKYRQYLGVDGCLYILLAHAHILHDNVSLPVVITLRDLLIIDEQDHGNGKEQP